MPKYRTNVEGATYYFATYQVEADDELAAEERAAEIFYTENLDADEIEWIYVEEIEE